MALNLQFNQEVRIRTMREGEVTGKADVDGEARLSLTVTNTGRRYGTEIVQTGGGSRYTLRPARQAHLNRAGASTRTVCCLSRGTGCRTIRANPRDGRHTEKNYFPNRSGNCCTIPSDSVSDRTRI
jgi:hypothetical protein